jgi:DNA-directed RNA polymerase subunit H (RpoH/RPB5)
VIRRPLGTLLIVGASAGVAYKLGKGDTEKIQEHTGVPPDQLSEEDLKEAMQDLDIQSQPLDQQDKADVIAAQAPGAASPGQPQAQPAAPVPAPTPSQAPDYIAELQQLAGLHDQGIITNEEFEAKKRQLLGL